MSLYRIATDRLEPVPATTFDATGKIDVRNQSGT
jgi:hypothetical protein